MGLNKRLIDQAGGAAGVVNTDNFNIVTYTGTSGTQSITGVGFQPDLIWAKNRTAGFTAHVLSDSVRGIKQLTSSGTDAEGSSTNMITSYDSDGFGVGDAFGLCNGSGYNFVAWCFKGGGSAVSNTDGSITSTVSANQAAGFSIVSYTGNLTNITTATGASVGHGLSSPPELIIFKVLSTAENWVVYSSELDNWSTNLHLNTTDPKDNQYSTYPIADPTSDVFYTNYLTAQNVSGNNYIAYCFHSVDGYQKVGSYTSNASVKITTGFEPRWIMQKYTGVSSNWWIMDTARYDGSTGTHGGKLVKPYLEANTYNAEGSVPPGSVEFVSDGFYPTNFFNSNGVIYLAIA